MVTYVMIDNLPHSVFNSADSSGFDFTCLLHTYFSVPDVLKATVSGLSGLKYLDKVNCAWA